MRQVAPPDLATAELNSSSRAAASAAGCYGLFGLMLIVAFSLGLPGVLVSFGLVLVYARGLFGRLNLQSGLLPRVLPIASALVIVLAGSLITAQALLMR